MTRLLTFITINFVLLFLFPLWVFSQGKSGFEEMSWEVTSGPNLEEFKVATVSVQNFSLKNSSSKVPVSITARRAKKDQVIFLLAQRNKKIYSFTDSTIDHPSLHPSAWVADLNNDGLSDIILELWPGGGIGTSLWSRFLILMQKPTGSFSRIAFNCDAGIPIAVNNKVYLETNSRITCYSDSEWNSFVLSNLYEVKDDRILNSGKNFGYPKFDGEKQLPSCALAQGEDYYLFPDPGESSVEYYDK